MSAAESADLNRLRRLEAIVERSPDAIVATDADGAIREFNLSAQRLFGYAPSEVVGRPVTLLVPADRREEADELWARVREGALPTGFETERRRRDGTTVPVAVTLLDFAGAQTERSGVAIYTDLTRRREHEASLAGRRRQLRSLADRSPRFPIHVPPDRTPERVEAVLALVREELGMEVAMLNEAVGDELVFRATAGAGEPMGIVSGRAIPLEHSICDQVLDGRVDPIVPDARRVSSLADLPAVSDGRVRAYVGVPVTLGDGDVYGTLCAVSGSPTHTLGERDVRFLRVLAGLLGEQLTHDRRRDAERRMQVELGAASALLVALGARAGDSVAHGQAVVELATAVALALGVVDRDLDVVQQVALLHDVGKVAIPDLLLDKPGPLSDTEWELMREHPGIGAGIVAAIPPLAHLVPLVRAEHERWDGTGYPDGLAGSDIPLISRIVFACDAWQAMRSPRPYRPALGEDQARAELTRAPGGQFDPSVVDALLLVLDDAPSRLDPGPLAGATRS